MRGGVRVVLLLCVGVAAAACSVSAFAQSPLGLNPAPVEEPLAARLWMSQSAYVEGDAAHVFFTVNRSSYVYLLDVRPDGKVRMLFPNGYSLSNYVSAGTYSLPEGAYSFFVDGPAGTEHLQIVASLVPLALPMPSAADPFPLVGGDPNEALALLQEQLNVSSATEVCLSQWATAWCSFTVVAKPQTTACACPPVSSPPLAAPPILAYSCPTTPTPPLSCPPAITYGPPVAYTPPVCPVPPLPYPPTTYCPPVVYSNPCPPPVSNPCFPFFGFLFGFQISIGTGY